MKPFFFYNFQVHLSKTPNPDCGISLEWTESHIPAEGCVRMELIWSPTVVCSQKTNLQFIDQRFFKKDVLIILKSVDKSPATAGPAAKRVGTARPPQTLQLVVKKPKSPKLSTGAIPKTNRLPSRNVMQVIRQPLGVHNPVPVHQDRQISPQWLGADKENQPSSSSQQSPNLSAMLNEMVFTPKSDVSVAPPSKVTPAADFSALIGQIKFTPDVAGNKTQAIDAQVSEANTYWTLNTPQAAAAAHVAAFNPTLCSTIHRVPTPNQDPESIILRRNLFGGEQQTFELATDRPFHFQMSPDHRSPIASPQASSIQRIVLFTAPTSPGPASRGSVTASPSRVGLSMISEETMVDRNTNQSMNQKTYVVESNSSSQTSSPGTGSSNQAMETACTGTPLRKKFASMRNLAPATSSSHQMLRNNQGSMPNLNDIQQVRPIESNRYFYQELSHSARDLHQVPRSLCSSASSMASNAQSVHDINFSENEILAESSRFNLNRCHESGTGTGIGVTYRLEYTPSLETIPQTTSAATFAIPQSKNHRRGLSERIPPLIQTTSASPPRNSSAQSKRVRSETCGSGASTSSSNQSTRRSYKHSPPKRSRNNCDQSDDSGASLFYQSGTPLRATKSTSSLAKGETSRLRNWNHNKFAQSSSDLALKQQRDKRVTLFDAEMHMQGMTLNSKTKMTFQITIIARRH